MPQVVCTEAVLAARQCWQPGVLAARSAGSQECWQTGVAARSVGSEECWQQKVSAVSIGGTKQCSAAAYARKDSGVVTPELDDGSRVVAVPHEAEVHAAANTTHDTTADY